MLTRKLLTFACATAVAVGLLPTTAAAQLPDRRTFFTFSGPFTIPGATLPAGKYVFRLANPETSARVVQVFSADGRTPYGMFFSRPAERRDPAPKSEIRFLETAKGMPAAVQTWWYEGERTGFEFVYPKAQARKLAQGSKDAVLTTQAETTTAGQTNTSNLTRISASGQESNADAAAESAGITQEGQVADASLAFSAAPQSNSAQARSGLPATASDVPMFAVFGLLAIAGAVLLRVWRNTGSSSTISIR